MPVLAQINAGDVIRVWQRNYDVYIRLWRTEMIAPLFEPFFTVIGFGWGVGALIAVGKCAGKGCVKSGVLPHDHRSAPGWV